MGKTLHKAAMMKEFIKNGNGDFTNWQELEQQMKNYVADNDIYIPSSQHGNYVTNDIHGGIKRTKEILDEDPALRKLFEKAMKQNQKDAGLKPTGLGEKSGKVGGGDGKQYPGRPGPGTRWNDDDRDPIGVKLVVIVIIRVVMKSEVL